MAAADAPERAFFARLSKIVPPDEALLYSHIEDPVLSGMVQEKIRHTSIGYNSMLRTSLSPNVIKGGFRFNVIPADATATLDVRFLPDEDQEAFAEALRKVIDDPAVEVALAEPGSRKPSPPSRIDTEMFQALERAQRKLFPEASTLPMMLTGATDSAQLRSKGVQAYGLGSMSSDDDSARVHGNDERLSVEGLGRFLEYIWWSVIDVAAAKGGSQ
jgi:acetylornithine deacetylase/succinyl-diaminopimelate desuccinylase-like protein